VHRILAELINQKSSHRKDDEGKNKEIPLHFIISLKKHLGNKSRCTLMCFEVVFQITIQKTKKVERGET